MFELPTFRAKPILWEAGKGFAKIIFSDEILPSLRKGPKAMADTAWRVAQYWAPRVENYAKTNAPWTDRTGNARNGLAARSYRDGQETGIILYHQVPYGIYLETRWDGRYAIIDPTIAEMGPKVMQSYNRILERM